MTDIAVSAGDEPEKKSRKLLLPVLALALGAAGFGSTYLGLWSPAALLKPAEKPHAAQASAVTFVTVPTVDVPLPGGAYRGVVLSAVIETDQAHAETVTHLMPRVLDAFTTFLSSVDPAAYGKRGVLEIIRAELITRTRYVLGEEPVKDLLITEFRFK